MKIIEIRELLFRALTTVMEESDARETCAAVLRTAMEKDERIDPISAALDDIQIFEDRHRPEIRIAAQNGATMILDLNGAPALCYYSYIHRQIRDIARSNGVAFVGVRNSGGVHTLSTWTSQFADEGLLAIFAWNGGSYTTVPFGSTDPFFGTNPISYAIPTEDSPIVADLSTSQIPYMDFARSFASGDPLPDGSALDPQGRPTTNAFEAYDPKGDDMVRMRPMGGGPKGSAIMLLLEVMTGALVGAKMGRAATDDPFTPEEFGGFFLCVDSTSFGLESPLVQNVQVLARDIRGSRPAIGHDRVTLPGDREKERASVHAADGSLDLSDDTVERLRRIAGAAK